MRSKAAFAVLASGLLLMSGCVLKYPQPRNSRFTVDISQMEKAEFMHDTWVYRHPSKFVRDYPAMWLSAVEVFPNPVKKVKKSRRAAFDQLAARLQKQVQSRINKDFTPASASAPGVLDLRVAIIDIKPIVRMEEGGNEVIRTNTLMKGNKFELDAVDSQSGELIFGISTLLKGDDYDSLSDPTLVPRLEKEFAGWLDFLADSLHKAKTNPPARP